MSANSTEYQRAYYAANRDYINARKRAWRKRPYVKAKQPDQALHQKWWSQHRIRPADMAALLASQGGKCYLCGDPLDLADAFIEHDHRCCGPLRSCRVCRRGLSCKHCNSVAGLGHDDPDRLRRIADALEAAIDGVTRRLTERLEQADLFDDCEADMQDLSKPLTILAPSSQEGGNLVQGTLAAKAMTAPGSKPVTPLPDPNDQANPEPNASVPIQDGPLGLGVLIPVADTTRPRVNPPGSSSPNATGVPGAAPAWKPTPAGHPNLNVAYPGTDFLGEKTNA